MLNHPNRKVLPVLAIAAAFSASAARSASLPPRPILTLEPARAIVDSEGLRIVPERVDDAAALFRRERGAFEDAINGNQPAATPGRSFVLIRGGIPLAVRGHVIGAIGVSADTPDHDEQIAKAGVTALAQ